MLTNRSSVLGRSVVAAIMGCLAFGSPAYTQQITGVGDTTSTPVAGVPHNYITGVSEIVNPANGALSIRIQVPTPHERGANWPTNAFTYDSSELYSLVPSWVTNGNPLFTSLTGLALQDAEGSSVSGQTLTLSFTLPGPPYTTYECEVTSGYIYTDTNGGKHGLGLEVTTPVQGGPSACTEGPIAEYQNHYVGGDEQYKAYVNPSTRVATVIDLHGNAVAPTSTSLFTEDVNGNEQTESYNSGTLQIATTTGRNITTTPTSNGYNFSVPGVAPVSGQAAAYVATDETVGAPSARLNFSIVNGGNACQLTSISNATYSTKQPASVTLPNGETYQFQYDSASGLIDKITYPTGAWVEYTWTVIPNSEGVQYRTTTPNGQGGLCAVTHDWFAITKRVVSDDGTNADEEQDFSYSTVWPAPGNPNSYEWTSKKTTVTTKDVLHSTQFNTVYSYSPMEPPPEADTAWEDLGYVPQENTIQYFDTNASLLKTVTKTWQSMNLLSGECETIPNVGTSGKFYTYQTYSFGNTGMVILNPGALLTTLPVDVQEYGSGVPTGCTNPGGTPLRETKTTYASFASTPLFSTYSAILDRPSTVQVYGNGALLSETDYNYDQVAPTVVSSVLNHDDVNYGLNSTAPRGNPTTVTKKCFVGSAGCTNSVTTYAYDNDGNVLSATDACGNTTCSDMPGSSHTTTYNYADNYTDGTPPGKTNAYVTTITEPSPNGLQ